MQRTDSFQKALGPGLLAPGVQERCRFDTVEKRVYMYVGLFPGRDFGCPLCGWQGSDVYEILNQALRHLNFFQHVRYLRVRAHQVEWPDCRVKQLPALRAREAGGSNLIFEAFLTAMAKDVPVKVAA